MTEVTEKSREELGKSLAAARAEATPRNQAWILRDGLDRALTQLKKIAAAPAR